MGERHTTRRGLLKLGLTGAVGLTLGGCDAPPVGDWVGRVLDGANDVTYRAQHLLLAPDDLAPEYTEADISPRFKPNGSTDPEDETYKAMAADGFKTYRLKVDGLVEKPLTLSLKELRAMPSRTQITRHDCVEGWSCIGKWKGTPLAHVLYLAGVKDTARYAVFHCADAMDDGALDGPTPFYGSIDLVAAHHAQTILAYDLNDAALKVPNGAPIRLRVERQLGYKMSKYVMRIELVESFARFGQGKGGYWEDTGYDWYAGI